MSDVGVDFPHRKAQTICWKTMAVFLRIIRSQESRTLHSNHPEDPKTVEAMEILAGPQPSDLALCASVVMTHLERPKFVFQSESKCAVTAKWIIMESRMSPVYGGDVHPFHLLLFR